MGFVRTSSEDDDAAGTEASAGAPPFPGDPDDVDWADPELIKVHYDVSAWNWEQRAELSESLAERNVPHVWLSENGLDELVVPELAEEFTDVLFEELEAELGPFAVPLGADEEGVEFALDDLTEADLDTLRAALLDAEIPHRWAGSIVMVAADAQDAVDDLLDAIEAGEVATLDDGAGGEGAPEGALHDLYAIADVLARDPEDIGASDRLADLVPQLSPSAPPYGLAGRAWTVIVGRARELSAADNDPDGDTGTVANAADELRAVTRPYV